MHRPIEKLRMRFYLL